MFGLAGWDEKKTRDLLGRVMVEYQDPLMRSCIKVYVVCQNKGSICADT